MSSEDIKQQTKATFKKYVKGRIEKLAFDWLIKEKAKQSKCSSIFYEKLQIQDYVISNKFTTHPKKLLLQMRTATYPVFANVKFLVKDTRCPCCLSEEDTMQHQLECREIHKNIVSVSKSTISISQIFSKDVNKQSEVTCKFEEATRQRKRILNNKK